MLREDIEVLCDARTLDECGIVRTDYAMMLCRNSAFSELSYSAGCHMSASGRHLKTRLRTISRSQKQNLLSRIASVLLCSAIILVCLTNPIISQSNDYTEYIDNYSALTGIDDRELYLEDKVTVSQYLEEVSNILSEKTGEDAHLLLGRNLEKFKRICSIDENIPKELTKELRKLKTDEAMTNRSCALISQCIVYILSGGRTVAGSELTVLPEVISDGDLNEILLPLTEAEANAVRSCYNIGVKGAVTSFDRIYTEAMMKLILSRITNDWMREKFSGFYQKIEPAKADKAVYSDEMLDLLENIEVNGVIYVRDPAVTKAESVILRRILGAAFAGEDENAYYLKKTEDTCSFDTAEFLIKRGGYTAEKMLEGYAKLASGNASSSGIIAYPVLRSTDADLSVRGNAAKAVRTAAMNMYSLGIIDSEYQAVPGDPDRAVIDLGKHLSCGESLASAYRLAYYAINQQD